MFDRAPSYYIFFDKRVHLLNSRYKKLDLVILVCYSGPDEKPQFREIYNLFT